ncbi:MAG: hypothetical protein KKH94_03155 [Candidatus Omnitrophica bacterium]|nr:hypothetical protein [Candidatus Omnitrophota bacterium]
MRHKLLCEFIPAALLRFEKQAGMNEARLCNRFRDGIRDSILYRTCLPAGRRSDVKYMLEHIQLRWINETNVSEWQVKYLVTARLTADKKAGGDT